MESPFLEPSISQTYQYLEPKFISLGFALLSLYTAILTLISRYPGLNQFSFLLEDFTVCTGKSNVIITPRCFYHICIAYLRFSPPSAMVCCSPLFKPITNLFRWLTSSTFHSSSSVYLSNGSKLRRRVPENSTGSCKYKKSRIRLLIYKLEKTWSILMSSTFLHFRNVWFDPKNSMLMLQFEFSHSSQPERLKKFPKATWTVRTKFSDVSEVSTRPKIDGYLFISLFYL